MTKAIGLYSASFILASSLLLVGSALAADPSIFITPDTSVVLSGSDSVRIWISASDPDPLDTITVEKAYGTGTYIPKTELAPISDEFYFHPDTIGLYTFIFPVTDEDGATSADTTDVLVGPLVVDFRQASNKNPIQGDVIWIGSILQQSNSKYYEGMSTLQRIVFINVPKTSGHVHTLNFSHQANKATSHAYDFLTSWPQGVQAGTEIGGSTMFVNVNECGPEIGPPANLGAICAALHTSGFTATPDAPDAMGTLLGDDVASRVSAYEANLGNRTVEIYGNTAISAASITFNGYTGSTAKYADYTLTWTSSSDSVVIEIAGHLAAGTDPLGQPGVGYGAGKGSAYISGGPYHFKLSTLDGASLGSQDNQIKGADIIIGGPECEVTPDADSVCVGGSATFTDNSTGGTPQYTWAWTGPNGFTATTQSITINNAQLVNAGTYQVIVTDANDLADTCYATLTVHDQPVCEITGDSIICPGSTAELCATDDPDYEYLWSNDATTPCITVGAEGVYWVAVTDENGCADTCYFSLTVDDTEPPVAQCPGDITVDNDPGQCDAVVSFTMDAADNCPGVSVSSSPVSGSTFPVGITPVEVIAADASGNADTCYFNVTVNDTEPPVAQCPGDMTVDNDPGQCDAVVSFTIDAADNCPGVSVSSGPVSGSTFPVGTTPVEVIATDASGNADTCYFDVTVNDTEPPVAQCPGDITVDNDPGECGAVVSFTIDATDNCPGQSVSSSPASGSSFPLGTTTVEVIATDASGNADTCYFNLTVNDTEPPVAQCPGDITVDNDPGQCDAVVSFTIDAADNCPGVSVSSSPVSGSTFPVGTTPVEVIATDASGNANTCYFNVTVNDTEPPVPQCPGDITQDNDPGECDAVVSFTIDATDNCPGVSVSSSPVSGSTFPLGTTSVEVIATDASGNADTCYFDVTINEAEPPVALCPDDITTDNDPGECGAVVSFTIDATDNCPGVTVSSSPASGSTFPVGTTPVEVIATDASGNADTCYFNVTVNDTEPPVAQCSDDINVGVDIGECTAVVSFSIDATDNCPGVTVAANPSSGSTFPVGTTPVEVIATDASGNGDTCYFNVTVNDTEPPVAQCSDDINVGVDIGECTAVVSFSIGATDNCPGENVSSSPASGSTFPLGTTPVEVIATDAAGNADTCYFDVTVYNQPPVLTCPDSGSVHAGEDFVSSNFSVSDPESHMTSITFLSIDPAATNNPVITPIHVEWTTTCDEDGDYTICLEATDECGAKDTCCFVVTVGNQPPELTCPDNDSAKVDTLFVSTDYYVYDPDDASGVTVTLHSITPAPVDSPILVDNHVEWIPRAADYQNGPDFTITLLATDPCGATNSCSFVVTVYNLPPIIIPPPDDSIHAGHYFVSEDFSVSDTKGPVTVAICGVDPPSVHTPTIVESHVELQTECSEAGMVYTVCLEATDDCGAKDTGYFNVTVYNRPPDVVPPDDENIHAGEAYVSATITATDPDEEPVNVIILEVSPTPTNPPVLVGDRVEWSTECEDNGDYLFSLMAADSCGLTDTAVFTLTVYNEAPNLTCPGDDSVHAGNYFISADFSAIDPDGDPVIVTFCGISPLSTNPPSIIANHIEWQTDCLDDGVFSICLVAADSCGEDDTCYFEVEVYNQPPVLDCAANGSVTAGSTFVSGSFSFYDPDGDQAEAFFVGIAPPATNAPLIIGDHVEWVSTPSESGTYVITLGAADSCECDTAECDFYVTVTEPSDSCTNVLIPEIDCVNPGEYVCLPILIDNNTTPFGGFELEVEFDYTSMTLVSVEPGEAMQGFEHFTHRLLPCPACGCCKYKILLYGQYDLPNGVENVGTPIPVTPLGVYRELVNLCFVVNNNENLRGLTIPVCFEWEGTVEDNILIEDWNCSENTFSSWSGDTLFTSDLLCQFRADLCDSPTDRIQPEICFQRHICGDNCGGIPICAAGPGACKRGDINMNDMTHEVADAVLFASYFVYGTSVFHYDMAYQICATDVNADGRTLTLSDLVYLIRVILQDAVEMPKLTPSSEVANVIVYNGIISTECAAPIGAILFEFDSAVNPTLLADMEMVHNGNKVLVWSSKGMSFSTSEVLSVDAELVSVSAVDRDSRELETTITAKVAPTAFALHAAYPNPFNPFTNLSFDLPEAMNYSLKIYNVAGQLVRNYEGLGSVGLNLIAWDGRDNVGTEVSSGIYFYRLTAAGFSATHKMVMMK